MLLLALVLAVTGQAAYAAAPTAAASAHLVAAASGGTGTGGAFNPLQTRIADTRNGVGGASTPLTANTWRSYSVAGIGGVPPTGVSSVMVTVTVLTTVSGGTVALAPNTSQPASPLTFLLYNPGDSVSNTGVVDVGTDGKIAVRATSSVDVLIDVQGYFTTGNGSPAPGGYVSANNTRIVSTSTGLGGATGPLAANSTTTFTAVGGSTGIPATATAIYANITIVNTGTGGGYVIPFATGATKPGTSLNFPGAPTAGTADATALGATIDLNSSGQFSLWVSGSVQVLVDVQGYFDGEPSNSGFTPLNARVFDSRSPAVTMAANSVTTVQVGGVDGLPAGSNSLSGVALNVEVIPGTAGGYLRMWSGDQAEPTTSVLNFDTGRASSLAVVQPAVSDGTIKIRNVSSTAVNVVLDAEGYLTNPSVLPQAYGTNVTASGSRTAAAMISHTLTDRSGVQINPTNGNLLYSQSLLNIAGIGQSVSIGLRYNSLNDTRPTLNTGLFETQLYRNGTTGAVTYTAPDGGGYVYTPVTGTGATYTGPNAAGTSNTLNAFVIPNGINATLVRVGTGTGPGTEYDLTFHPSQVMNVYVDNGSNITLNSTQDVTGFNKTTYAYANSGKGALTEITDTQGRTIDFAYTSPNNTTQPSSITDNSLGRTITLTYGATSTPANGAVTSVVDATGARTQFAYNTAGKLSSITDPLGNITTLAYTASKITTLTAASTSTTTTPSTWTFAYGTTVTGSGATAYTTTTVTDPDSHPEGYRVLVAAPQVSGVVDGNGHVQSATFNSHNDVTSTSSAYNDTTTANVATSTYNLTQVTSPSATPGGGGAVGRNAKYEFSTSPSGGAASTGYFYDTADYRPKSVTDADTNKTTLTYNTWGEATTISSAGGAAGDSHRTYQGDPLASPVPACGGKPGQLCTSTDGKGNVTSYAYNTAGNLHTLTPPTPLGADTFTYDAAGRKISEIDGRNHTSYTCYDDDDRILQVSYTSAACSTVSGVTYTYDADGNQTARATAATGITTHWTYDAENRATQQTESSGTTSATYDPASNVLTYTDPAGTTTYTYDAANNVLTLAEPGGTCPTGATTVIPITTPNTTKCTGFTYDNNNRRLTTNLPNGVTNTVAYDTSGRIKSIAAAKAGTSSVSLAYDYVNAGAASGLLRTVTNNVASTNTTYGYDTVNRFATDTVKTGTLANNGTTVSSDSYTYDLNGNITKQVTGGQTTDYGYNAADQMCWSAKTTGTGCTTPTYGATYTYDEDGNTLTGDATTGTNTFTNYNQLASTTVGGAQTYSYSGTSNTQRISAGSTTFTNGLLGQVTYSAGGTPNADYIRDPSGTLIAMQTGGHSYYYTTDNIGSVLQLTADTTGDNAATYTYNPYGKTLTATGSIATTNPYRYAGGYTDTTGLIKFGARYYNPTLGRFTQPDPSGQESNRYAYTGDNPVTNTDSDGLNLFDTITTGIALVAGAVATVADAIPGGQAVGLAAGGVGLAADGVKTIGDATGVGDGNPTADVAADVVGIATAGTSAAAGAAGADSVSVGADVAGNVNDAADSAGAYDGYDE